MIEHYQFGQMIINGMVYEKDLIVSKDGIRPDWWRHKGHRLTLADIQDALDSINPSIVVVGTGHDALMKLDDDLQSNFARSGIQLFAEDTTTAVSRFNQLLPGHDCIMGAFHLTC